MQFSLAVRDLVLICQKLGAQPDIAARRHRNLCVRKPPSIRAGWTTMLMQLSRRAWLRERPGAATEPTTWHRALTERRLVALDPSTRRSRPCRFRGFALHEHMKRSRGRSAAQNSSVSVQAAAPDFALTTQKRSRTACSHWQNSRAGRDAESRLCDTLGTTDRRRTWGNLPRISP